MTPVPIESQPTFERGVSSEVTIMTDDDLVVVRRREMKAYMPRPTWDRRGFPMSSRWLSLSQILGTGCGDGHSRLLLDLLQHERGWIAMVELPDIGDAGYDHRTLSSVPDTYPAIGRLCIAAAMWLSEIRATWVMERDADGVVVNAEEENIIAIAAPFSAARIISMWRERHRVMVVVPQRDRPPHGFIFEPPYPELRL